MVTVRFGLLEPPGLVLMPDDASHPDSDLDHAVHKTKHLVLDHGPDLWPILGQLGNADLLPGRAVEDLAMKDKVRQLSGPQLLALDYQGDEPVGAQPAIALGGIHNGVASSVICDVFRRQRKDDIKVGV